MNLYTRLFLVSCMLTSVIYGQQRFLLSNPYTTSPIEPIVRDSEDLNFEHALFDYHHYYAQSCKRSWFDFQVAPFYTHLKTIEPETKPAGYIDTRATTQLGGAQLQAQFNVCNFYIRANTNVAHIKTTYADVEKAMTTTSSSSTKKYAFTGVDDITIKAGYDLFFCNEKHHAGIYMLGGIPVNNSIIVATDALDLVTKAVASNLNNDRLGVYCYRIGAGFNSAFTLYNCDEQRLTWHTDIQYAYAFPKTGAEITTNHIDVATFKYTPGQFVSAWAALHYAVCAWNFELGSMFETMFDEKLSVENSGTSAVTLVSLSLPEKPGATIAFTAKPYVAAAYNTTVCEYPLTIGLGVGYEYDKMHDLHAIDTSGKEVEVARKHDAFQGVNVWGNITMSF